MFCLLYQTVVTTLLIFGICFSSCAAFDVFIIAEAFCFAHPQIGFFVFGFAHFINATDIAILFLALSFGFPYNKIRSGKEAAYGQQKRQI